MTSMQQKKEFIRWFLKNYKLKRRECVWVLNYLLEHESILHNVHFVDEAHYCPRSMVMSTTETESIPFRYYKGNLMTADAEKSFHDMRLHPDEKMYIQLNFPNKHQVADYVLAHEDNPHMPEYLVQPQSNLLDSIQKDMQRHRLQVLIDRAIDSGDKEKFMEYSNMMEGVLL